MWSYRTSTTRSGRSGTNDRSLPTFHRLYSELRGVRTPSGGFAQFHGWLSNVVTSGSSSARRERRVAIGNAPMTPMLASPPSSRYRPSSSEPIASSPVLCGR
jgi:hypothetical protein